jgi:hypothetical protein
MLVEEHKENPRANFMQYDNQAAAAKDDYRHHHITFIAPGFNQYPFILKPEANSIN